MDRIFIENKTQDGFEIAAIDRHRIFSSENPGKLATIFEYFSNVHDRNKDAQLFYALAPSIGADDFFIDLYENYRSKQINNWSISVTDSNIDNIFQAVVTLNHKDRLELYQKSHSITPSSTISCDSNSLFSLLSFAEHQSWKTGILQKCIDCIVKIEYRNNPEVYALIDEQYRAVMRFKLESEICNNKLSHHDNLLLIFVKRILLLLGLSNSHDTKLFSIPLEIENIFINMEKFIIIRFTGCLIERLSQFLILWSGASIKSKGDKYCLEVDPDVIKALNYTQDLLPRPDVLEILDTPL